MNPPQRPDLTPAQKRQMVSYPDHLAATEALHAKVRELAEQITSRFRQVKKLRAENELLRETIVEHQRNQKIYQQRVATLAKLGDTTRRELDGKARQLDAARQEIGQLQEALIEALRRVQA